jgi:hypothetical protein
MPDASKTSDRVSGFHEGVMNSRFVESMIGTDWNCADIATSDERTSPRTGVACMLASAIAVVATLSALVIWLTLSKV